MGKQVRDQKCKIARVMKDRMYLVERFQAEKRTLQATAKLQEEARIVFSKKAKCRNDELQEEIDNLKKELSELKTKKSHKPQEEKSSLDSPRLIRAREMDAPKRDSSEPSKEKMPIIGDQVEALENGKGVGRWKKFKKGYTGTVTGMKYTILWQNGKTSDTRWSSKRIKKSPRKQPLVEA